MDFCRSQGYLYFGDRIDNITVMAAKKADISTIYMPAISWRRDWAGVEAVGGIKVVEGIKLVSVDNISELVGLLWPTGEAA